jgi:hypothetical protein
MEPFTKALKIVARVMRRRAEYHLGRAEEHWRLWREGDQLQGPCVPRSDAVADGLDLTRVPVIREL